MAMRLLTGMMVFLGALGTVNSSLGQSEDAEGGGPVTFQRVLDLTIQNSFKIALADEQVDSAFRSLEVAKRRRYPRLSAQGWFSGDLFEMDEWGGNNIGSYLALDWDFYQNGAILQMIAQSWANLTSALLTRRRTVSEQIYTATSLFYDAVKAKRDVEIAEQSFKLDDMRLAVVRSEFSERRRTRSELGDAEARAFESDLALTRAGQDLRNAMRSLRQLTRDETIVAVEDLPRDIAWTLDFSVEDAVRTGLYYQPNVLIVKANLELARLGVKYAKLKRWPSVRFLTGTDYAFAPLARPEEFGFRAGVILSYPLYDAGDRRFRIEEAKSGVRLGAIRLRQAHDQMEQEVSDSYAAVSNQLDLLRLAEKRHEKVRTDFAIAREQFGEKIIGEPEMTRIELLYLQSLQRIENLRLEALLARAKLLQNVGVSSTDEITAFINKGAEREK